MALIAVGILALVVIGLEAWILGLIYHSPERFQCDVTSCPLSLDQTKAVAGKGTILICHNPTSNPVQMLIQNKTSVLNAHLNHGDILGVCPSQQPDPPSAPLRGSGPILVCHKESTGNRFDLFIQNNTATIEAHLAHGDTLGACTLVPNPFQQPAQPSEPLHGSGPILVCHKDSTGNQIDLFIQNNTATIEAHLGHGDKLGGCEGLSTAPAGVPATEN